MQSFETSDDLHMRAAWNKIRPRLTRPQSIDDNPESVTAIYFQGTATNLKPNDPLLIVTGSEGGKEERTFRRVASINVQTAEDRTRVTLQPSDFRAGLLQNIAARFQHLEDFGIAEDNPAVSKVVSHLEGILEGGLDGPTDVGELLESIAGTQASIVAGNPADAPVQAWLDGLSQHAAGENSQPGRAARVPAKAALYPPGRQRTPRPRHHHGVCPGFRHFIAVESGGPVRPGQRLLHGLGQRPCVRA
jgi:hypothetical protein